MACSAKVKKRVGNEEGKISCEKQGGGEESEMSATGFL